MGGKKEDMGFTGTFLAARFFVLCATMTQSAVMEGTWRYVSCRRSGRSLPAGGYRELMEQINNNKKRKQKGYRGIR